MIVYRTRDATIRAQTESRSSYLPFRIYFVRPLTKDAPVVNRVKSYTAQYHPQNKAGLLCPLRDTSHDCSHHNCFCGQYRRYFLILSCYLRRRGSRRGSARRGSAARLGSPTAPPLACLGGGGFTRLTLLPPPAALFLSRCSSRRGFSSIIWNGG